MSISGSMLSFGSNRIMLSGTWLNNPLPNYLNDTREYNLHLTTKLQLLPLILQLSDVFEKIAVFLILMESSILACGPFPSAHSWLILLPWPVVVSCVHKNSVIQMASQRVMPSPPKNQLVLQRDIGNTVAAASLDSRAGKNEQIPNIINRKSILVLFSASN